MPKMAEFAHSDEEDSVYFKICFKTIYAHIEKSEIIKVQTSKKVGEVIAGQLDEADLKINAVECDDTKINLATPFKVLEAFG